MSNNPTRLWLVGAIESFAEAIHEQSQYAESNGLSWDRFGSVAAYVFSFYGITTFLVAVLLNRTMLLAGATNPVGRVPPAHNEIRRFLKRGTYTQTVVLSLLRLLLLYILALRAHDIFVALSISAINDKPGVVCNLTSFVSQFVHYDPVKYAENKFMRMPRDEVRFGPSSSMLWPVFTGVSYSLFVETFCSAVLNTKPFLEGGISLFELSIAIQEMSSGFFFLREHSIAKRPSEQVLIVCLFLVCDQFCNHINSSFFQNRYRLLTLIFLNFFFISYYVNNILKGNLFLFPLVISVTYLSLIFILWISMICFGILALALLTKNFDLSELNFTNYFAENNLDSEFFAPFLGLDLSQDFHVAVLNLGILAITLAGKSSYITQYSYVPLPRRTWLEANMLSRARMVMKALKSSRNDDVHQKDILSLFDDKSDEHYANIIANPTLRAMSGFNMIQNLKPESILKLRTKYIVEILKRVLQLLLWHFYRLFLSCKKIFGFQIPDRVDPPKFLSHIYNQRNTHLNSKASNSKDFETPSVCMSLFDEEDETPDYEFVSEEDPNSEASESDSDSEVDKSSDSSEPTQIDGKYEQSAFSELVSADGFIELLENQELINQHWNFLKEHQGVMTRSRLRSYPNSNFSSSNSETKLLFNLITSLRREADRRGERVTKEEDEFNDSDTESNSRFNCVICHYNPREIITWPCKCFAICEECRLRLVTKNMEGCVCCRGNVEGVSRIYLP